MRLKAFSRFNKFGSKKTIVDGITFHSRAEARRYKELKLLQKAGEIKNLCLQEEFKIYVNTVFICTYISDFSYLEKSEYIIEDVKGIIAAHSAIKLKLFCALHPQFTLRITKNGKSIDYKGRCTFR